MKNPIWKLNSITPDALSEFLDVPVLELTAVLNGHFKMNFYEFINNYRIKEAKEILAADISQEKTISDIFLAVGFNSKSVFNTFFKKNVGLTPSEFRKKSIQIISFLFELNYSNDLHCYFALLIIE